MSIGHWVLGKLFPTPYSLLPTPYSLLPTPYSLLPKIYSSSANTKRYNSLGSGSGLLSANLTASSITS
ncbi:hypothetical protein F8S12_23900 [Nostoc sp. WHI]|nr:hypothetical protein [Nostoc sp. WHI]